jgi:hypothetical protein
MALTDLFNLRQNLYNKGWKQSTPRKIQPYYVTPDQYVDIQVKNFFGKIILGIVLFLVAIGIIYKLMNNNIKIEETEKKM